MGKISENFEGTQHNGYWVSKQYVSDIINEVGFDTFIEEYSEYRVPKRFNNRQVFNRRNNDGNTYFSSDIETDNACLIWVYDSEVYATATLNDYGKNEEYISQKCLYAPIETLKLNQTKLCEIDYDRILLYFKVNGYYKTGEELSADMFTSFDTSYNIFSENETYIPEQLGLQVYIPNGDDISNNTTRKLTKKISPIFIERTNINGVEHITYTAWGNYTINGEYIGIPTAMTTGWYQGRRETPFSYYLGRDYNNTFTQTNYPSVQKNSDFIICPDLHGEWYGTPKGFLLWKAQFNQAFNDNTFYPDRKTIDVLPDSIESSSYWSMLTREAIESICYSFGVQWTGNLNKATNCTIGRDCIDPDIHIAKITDYGVSDEYYSGASISGLPYMDSQNIDIKKTDIFKYKKDQNEYEDLKNGDRKNGDSASMDISIPTLNPMSTFNTSYAISYFTLKNFANWLWNSDESTFSKIVSNATLYNNPIDCIIGCKMYPFDIENHHTAGLDITENLCLGRVKSPHFGRPIKSNYNCVINLGTCSLTKTFNSFLDYEPYSNYYIYIPYCGVYELNSLNYINKKVDVKLIVDFLTGACTACVYANNLLLDQFDGHIGIDVPISTMDTFSLAEQQVRGKTNTVNNIVGSVASFATGNIAGGIMNLINAGESELENNMLKPEISKGVSSTPMISNFLPQKCYFIVSNPILQTSENFGKQIGYVCNKTYFLNQLKGFTKVMNPLIDFSVDEYEKNELINILSNGIYIKGGE